LRNTSSRSQVKPGDLKAGLDRLNLHPAMLIPRQFRPWTA
jgi:hypothetical protein